MNKNRKALLRLLRAFENAHEGWVFSGSYRPEDVPILKREYLELRKKLVNALTGEPQSGESKNS